MRISTEMVKGMPLQVSFETVIAPLANSESRDFSQIQGCVFPSLVAISKELRDASSEAEKKIDAYQVKCRLCSSALRQTCMRHRVQRGDMTQTEIFCIQPCYEFAACEKMFTESSKRSL